MTPPTTYLVTGAGGGVGGVGAMVADSLLAAGSTVRAMVHREDSRAEALREKGAHVVVGDLTNPVDVAAALKGVNRMFFSMSVSASYLEAATVVCSLAALSELDVLVNMSQMTVSQMTPTSTTESHHQRLHWLAERVIDWSPIPAVHVRPTAFLENPLFTALAAHSIREKSVLALPFGAGRTSPIAARDVADTVSAILQNPAGHIGAVYELTGPAALDIDGLAAQYSTALGKTITGHRLDFDDWKRELASSGADPHLQDHITTMARLHREDRYNRSTGQVQDLTGHPPQSVADYVRAHRELFD
ncbi:hydroxylase [Mycobacterium sp. 1245111.1]|uniref:NAD(P)H-binding protein n=1 Tax=Mycobacterium sp. 1245111.1 TaxID=1834073 RepID=UPI0007FFDBE6|nr:NAD(P)H-binding protein [Mycobacterium sp. 1245111.1]OBK32653.1 hydroxylase [Mycobacterium sp. 1245111.1]